MSTTEPATTGTCGIVGCDHAADLETTTRTGPRERTISRHCLDHATTAELAAVLAAA
ncbi:MAG: hypothetical protein ACRDZR_02740 [Acidimicrobiales bacterium]